jgi:hypothetical protein
MRPEQLRALAYIRRQGTEARLAEIRDRLAACFHDLEDFLDELDRDEVRRRPSPRSWSPHEVVDHLVMSHQPAVGEIAELIAGRRPLGGPIPASLQSPEPFRFRWEDLQADLRRVHESFLEAVERATDATPTGVRAPVQVVVQVREADGRRVAVSWVEDFDWKAYAVILRMHTMEHHRQIERALAALRAAMPTWV